MVKARCRVCAHNGSFDVTAGIEARYSKARNGKFSNIPLTSENHAKLRQPFLPLSSSSGVASRQLP